MAGRDAAALPRPASRTGPGRAQRAGRPRSATWKRDLTGWAFAFPFVAIFAVFLAGPVLASLVLAFTDFGLRDLRNPLGVDFVGLDNFVALFADARFWTALGNTVFFVVVGVPLTLILGLGAALALDRGIDRFRTLFRVGYYLPVVTSIVAVAVVWRFLLQPDTGIVNTLLGYVGIEGPSWLRSETWAMPSLIVMSAWRNMGALVIIFLAGLQVVPKEMHEAAAIDGAGAWGRFRHITLPLMRPTLLFGGVITMIGYLQFFEEPFVMTRGGPLDSTLSAASPSTRAR